MSHTVQIGEKGFSPTGRSSHPHSCLDSYCESVGEHPLFCLLFSPYMERWSSQKTERGLGVGRVGWREGIRFSSYPHQLSKDHSVAFPQCVMQVEMASGTISILSSIQRLNPHSTEGVDPLKHSNVLLENFLIIQSILNGTGQLTDSQFLETYLQR